MAGFRLAKNKPSLYLDNFRSTIILRLIYADYHFRCLMPSIRVGRAAVHADSWQQLKHFAGGRDPPVRITQEKR